MFYLWQTNIDFNISQLHVCTPQKMKVLIVLLITVILAFSTT